MKGRASQLVQRAEVARREGRLVDARSDLVEAVGLLRASEATGELLNVVKALAQVERDLGHGEAAIPLLEEAVGLARSSGDALLVAHTIRHLGDTYRGIGRVDLAEPCYEEALSLYRARKESSPLDLANALRSMAILKDATGRTGAARGLWEEARTRYGEAAVTEGVAECSARLARLEYVEDLIATVRDAVRRLRPVIDEDAARRPSPDAWSAKEIIGHLIDSASNNHQRFVRAAWMDELIFAGYKQDAWVSLQKYREAPWHELLDLWISFNLHLGRVMRAVPDAVRLREHARHNLDQLAWQPVPREQTATLDYFMSDYVGHLHHHLRQIEALRLPGMRG